MDLTETLIPSFLLQPLVENAFRHGLSPKEEGGCVTIGMEIEGDRLCIRVQDDGLGIDEARLAALERQMQTPPTHGEHVGLYNVATRLRLLGGRLEMQSHAGAGTRMTLYVPFVTVEEETDAEDSDC